MTTETNLPAPQAETSLAASQTDTSLAVADRSEAAPLARRRPISVAFLPLALVVFVILAITIAAWTFLAAAG